MRLFVAVEIPESLRTELAERCQALREKPRQELPKARWARPEAMHLTLSFLGETDPGRLPALHRELGPACAAVEPFELRLGDAGAFPIRGKARVLWTGLKAPDGKPSAPLADLRQSVAGAVERAAEVEPDTRPFHPHLTLARLKPPWGRSPLEYFQEAFGEPPGDAFPVAETVLFESELHPSGARYRRLGAYALGGES